MTLNPSHWHEFVLGDLFDVVYGVNLELNALDETTRDDPDGVPFVSRTASDNGVSAYVKRLPNVDPQPAHKLTVAGGGSVLSTFLQTRPFYSGRDLYVLYEKEPLSDACKLFVKTVIELDKYRFNYGRQANRSLPTMRIKLPTTSQGKPDWAWMDAYIESLNINPPSTTNTPPSTPLDTSNWHEFVLGELFDIRKGKRLTSNDQTEGDTPYIGAIDSNNGLANTIGQNPIHEGNTITLSYNGSVGEAFYQPKPYWATDDVNALYLRPEYGTLNASKALFICAVLRKEKYRFSYGRKWTLDNMKNTIIKLPATNSGNPNWTWMENYINSLPFGDHIPSSTNVPKDD